jgi:transposase
VVKDRFGHFCDVPVETGYMKTRTAPQLVTHGRQGIAEGGQRFGIPGRLTGDDCATSSEVMSQQGDQRVQPKVQRVCAILDNLSTQRATDVLLFSLAHPRWEFVFQPKYAAYLNLIEPWWKVLRSLALKGHRFETWADIEQAIHAATSYWNHHRHPFTWGKLRQRRHAHRPSSIALCPSIS